MIRPAAPPPLHTVEEMISGSVKERIAFLKRDRWVPHSQARRAFRRMALTMEGERVLRPLGVLLWGVSNAGKTAIFEQFIKQCVKDIYDAEEGVWKRPLLPIDCPEEASFPSLMDALLQALDPDLWRFAGTTAKVHRATYDALRIAGCRAIGIDNINNFNVGRGAGRVVTLNAMRRLTGREVGVAFICTGTQSARSVLMTDAQLLERFAFLEIKPLGREEFPEFVRKLVATYPLRLSRDLSDALAEEVFVKSEGLIGRAVNQLREAAILAIESGEEAITLEMLQNDCVLEALEATRLRASGQARY